jgi:ATP-dependent DNA helicase RecQ
LSLDVPSYRPNLRYEVLPTANEPQRRVQLVRLLREVDGPGIVYAADVRQVDLLFELVRALGFEVARDHGRMAAKQRKENRQRFIAGALEVMIATSGFDVSGDKPDIRFVIHYNLPDSLQAYAEESGRAGRDDRQARCVLLYQLEERTTPIYLVDGRYPRAEDLHTVYAALEDLGAAAKSVPLSDLRARTSSIALTKLRVNVALLKDLGVVHEQRGALLQLRQSGLSVGALTDMAEAHRAAQAVEREGLQRMIAYAESHTCRWKLLLDHVGETLEGDRCGQCDNCLHPLEEQISPPAERTKAADNT